MKVKITRPTFVKGEIVEAGESGELPETLARQLITAGKAVPIDDVATEAEENRENDGSKSSRK